MAYVSPCLTHMQCAWASSTSPCLSCVYGGPDGICRRRHHRQKSPGVACSLFRFDSDAGRRLRASASRPSDDEPELDSDGGDDYGEPVCLVDIVTGSIVRRWSDARACARGMGLRRPSRVVAVCRSHRIANRSRYTFRFEREYLPDEPFGRRAPILQVAETGELEAVYPCSSVAAEHLRLGVKDVERAVVDGDVVQVPAFAEAGSHSVRFERMSAMGQTHLSDGDIAPFLVDFEERFAAR